MNFSLWGSGWGEGEKFGGGLAAGLRVKFWGVLAGGAGAGAELRGLYRVA